MQESHYSYRTLCIAGGGYCLFLLGVAFVLQLVFDLNPCPLCLLDRIAIMGAGSFFLLGGLHYPKAYGLKGLYLGLATLCSLCGLFIAIRHVWIQSLPPEKAPACGPNLDYLLNNFPLNEVLKIILSGSGECTKIQGTLFGFSLAQWTLGGMVLLVGWAVFAGVQWVKSR